MRTDWIGLRVARYRDIAGMTQEQLAERTGVSRPYISLIENGERAVTKRTLLIALAEALQVSVPELLGQPRQPRTADDLVIVRGSAAIRRALDSAGGVLAHPDRLPADAEAVIAARAACDYGSLAELLPALIAEARTVANDGATEDARRVGLDALVKGCVFGALAMKTAGYVDLAMRLAERADLAAGKLGDPVHVAAAQFALCQALMAEGVRDRTLSLSSDGADALETHIGADLDARGWYISLHLQAALAAASLSDGAVAQAHLQEAADAATDAGLTVWHRDDLATNVDIWRVTVSLENGGDATRAPDLAARVDVSRIRTPQRLARLHMDTGRGRYARDDRNGTIRAFLAAHEAASPEVRSRSAVREIIGQMVRDSRTRAGSAELRDLAIKVGMDPTDPESLM